MKSILSITILLFSFSIFAGTKVAVVKLIRGDVDALTLGKTTRLKANDWVESGAVVKTAEKSFVKLIFVDKSQMNVGPNSEMKIESFSGKDSGVIDLVKGKIRSQVTKDYLQIQDKDKSKLFIKTPNAVMGVRGTDFMIATNGKNTSTILFEGEVVFNKLEQRGNLSSRALEEIVDRGVRMFPGEFSVMEGSRPLPTVPSLLNIQQREKLEKNKDFEANRSPSNAGYEAKKTVVPEGLSGQQVSNSVETLKSEVAQVVALEPVKATPGSSDPEGYVKGDLIKPANGSFVHVDSGIIVPPGPNSVLDSNTNTYIPGQDSGKVAQDGSYIPPENIKISESGNVVVLATGPQKNPENSDPKSEDDSNDPEDKKPEDNNPTAGPLGPPVMPGAPGAPPYPGMPGYPGYPNPDMPFPGSPGGLPQIGCTGLCGNSPERVSENTVSNTNIVVKPPTNP